MFFLKSLLTNNELINIPVRQHTFSLNKVSFWTRQPDAKVSRQSNVLPIRLVPLILLRHELCVEIWKLNILTPSLAAKSRRRQVYRIVTFSSPETASSTAVIGNPTLSPRHLERLAR